MEVVLRVYDLIETSGILSRIGLGAYHTSITINDREYDFSVDGIRVKPPIAATINLVSSEGQVVATFKEENILGYFEGSVGQLNSVIRGLREKFSPNSYHLVSRNCNHFTDAFAFELVQKNTPSHINRMAWIGSWFCQDPRIASKSKEEDGSETNVANTKQNSLKSQERPKLTEQQKSILKKINK